MSTTVDNRVVEMRFDNKHFEKNVATTMSTLDKLKQKLNLTGASKGLENVNAAAGKVNMSGLGTAVETVRTKFSALEVMGVTALVNITNSAVNAGKRIVSALTIDPVTTGFNEYELKMNSVQTIMASTGESLETVNKYLAELNEYSDKTIYSFSDMTQNIGKFTNAGVKLEDAVMAIKGISNEAAVSGANANEASRAMYNFAQALSVGYIQRIDWKSIELANMATVDFKERLLDAAIAAGTVTKNADGLYATLENSDKYYNSAAMFTETLDDQWLTTEVLISTLKDYADETTEIGKKASQAATQVKTWTQLFDTLKESAQSGWAKTWEIFFGDFYEARDLFTMLSKSIGGVIDKMSDARNNLLEGVLGSKWKKFTKQINEAGISTEKFEEKLINLARNRGIRVDDLIANYGSLEAVISKGHISTDLIVKAIEEFADIGKDAGKATEDMTEKLEYFQKVVDQVWNGDFKNGQERVEALTAAGYDYATVQDLVNKTVDGHRLTLEDLSDTQLENLGYTEEQIEAIHKLADEAEKAGTPLSKLIEDMSKPSGRELLIDSFKNMGKSITQVIDTIKDAWSNVFGTYDQENTSNGIYSLIENFHELTESMTFSEEGATRLQNILEGVFSALDLSWSLASASFMGGLKILNEILKLFDTDLVAVLEKVAGYITMFNDWVEGNTIFGSSTKWADIAAIIVAIGEGIRDCVKAFLGLEEATGVLESIETILVKVFNWFAGLLQPFDLKGVVSSIETFFDSIESWIKDGHKFSDLGSYLIQGLQNGITDGIKGVVTAILSVATTLFETFCSYFDINSPSKVFMALGGFIIAGLILGLTGNMPVVMTTVQNLFSDLIAMIQNIDLGTVFAGILSAGTLLFVKRVLDILEMFGAFPKSLKAVHDAAEGMFKSIGGAFGAIKDLFKAKIWETRSNAIKNFAIAIAILAGAIALLTFVDQDKLFGAVLAVTWLVGLVGGLSLLAGKMKTIDFSLGKVALGMMGISAAVLILAIAMKKLSTIDREGTGNAIVMLAVMVGMLGTLTWAVGFLVKGDAARNMDKAGVMFLKMAGAMLLMAFVVKVISKFEYSDIEKGLLFMGGVSLIFAAVVAVANFAGRNVSKAGGMILKMAVAMGLMIGVVKLASMLNSTEVTRGLGVLAGVELLFAGMLIISNIAGKNSPKAGSMLLMMAGSLAIVVMVIKMINGITDGEIDRGIGVIGKIMLMFAGIIAVSRFAGQHAAKAGLMLIMMAGALAILTVVMYLLSALVKNDPQSVYKAVGIVAVLEILFGGLIAVSHLANDCEKTIGKMLIVIIALTAAVVALSFIPSEKLIPAVAGLSALMVAFGIMLGLTKFAAPAKGMLATVALMLGVVAALTGVVWALSLFETGDAMQNATALSILLIAFSGAIAILGKAGRISKTATDALIPMIAVAAGLGIILGALTVIVGSTGSVDALLPSTIALSVLLNAFTASIVILGKAGRISKTATDALIPMMVIAGGLAIVLGALAVMTSAGGGVEALIPTAIALSTLLIGLSAAVFILGQIGPMATMATAAMKPLAILAAGLAAVILVLGGLSKIPGFNELVSDGGNTLALFGYAIGEFVGSIIGGFGAGMSSGLPEIGENLAKFMEHMSAIPESAIDGVKNLASAILILTAAEFINGLVSFPWEDNPLTKFAEDMPLLVAALKSFSDGLGGANIDETKVESACNALKALAEAAATIPNEGGWVGTIFGENGIASFSDDLPGLATNLSAFVTNLGTFDDAAVTKVKCAGDAIKAIAAAAADIPNDGGKIAEFFGENSISAFGDKLPNLGKNLSTFATNLGTFDDSTVDTVACAGNAIKALAKAGESIDGQSEWGKKLFGDNSLATFGGTIESVGTNLKNFVTNLGTFGKEQIATVTSAVKAIKAIAGLASTDLKAAKKNLPGFGDELGAFATDIKNFCADIEGIGTDGIDTLIEAFTNPTKLTNLYKAGVGMMDKVIKGAESKENALEDAAEDIAESGADAVSSCESDFESAGQDLGSGLVVGINAMKQAVYDAAYALGQKAVQGEKDGQASASPSKLTIKAGKWLGEGLIVGMEKMFGLVYHAGEDLGSKATNSISSAIANISSMFDSDMDTQPTIRPVLDLSDVSAGVSTMNGMLSLNPSVGVLSNVRSIGSMMNRRQNGGNGDVVTAIEDLKDEIGRSSGNSYTINGITYDDGSAMASVIEALIREARIERRS